MPNPDDLPRDFPWETLTEDKLYRPKGCRECRGVGYAGRMGVYELLITTDEIRELAHERRSSWEVKQAALKSGMRTLRDDGWVKAIRGETSAEEVLRITKSDRKIETEELNA